MKRTKKKLQLELKTVAKLLEKSLREVRGGSEAYVEYTDDCDFTRGQGSIQTAGCRW